MADGVPSVAAPESGIPTVRRDNGHRRSRLPTQIKLDADECDGVRQASLFCQASNPNNRIGACSEPIVAYKECLKLQSARRAEEKRREREGK
jgi:hypothetical protein